MKDKIGQLLFIGISGTELKAEEADFIKKNNIGGIILFSRNVDSPQQLHKLCTDIQNCHKAQASKMPLFIGIDNEGGPVQRLKAPFTQWPALKRLGELDSTSISFKFGLCMGMEMKAIGINVDFAPVVDVLTNPKNTVIADRAISSNPELVAKLSSALVRGYIKAGIIPCAKHFPGHGNTIVDSHHDLPIEDTDMATLQERELIPFKKSFRARLDLVMTAHIKFKNIDPEWPVTLSEKFIKDLLRGELRYRNIVISDDLDMKALASHYDRAMIPVRALQAGCDILLYCNEPASPPIALEALIKAVESGKVEKSRVEEAYQRVAALKKESLANHMPLPMKDVSRIVGHPDHLRIAKGIAEGEVPEELLAT